MGRVLRTALPDGYFHVYARGVMECPLFLDDADRSTFLEPFVRCARRNDWACVALCLLSTHYHVVVEARRDELSAGMHALNGHYAKVFNRRHGRFGYLFAERFAARLIDTEDYLEDVCHYVVQNPVQAGLCDRAEDWPWTYSSYGRRLAA
jgi:REP element-mobilizing transposase RayT